jgi:phosphate transport system substrate-binding protein
MKSVLAVVLVALGVVGCTERQGSDIRKGTLDVLVTESHLPLVQQLAADYRSIFPEAVVNPSGATTRSAIVDMVNDSVQCIVVDRRLNGEERAAAESRQLRIIETDFAFDGLAVIVHPQNKMTSLTMDELASFMTGQTGLWNFVPRSGLKGVVGLCLTGKNSGLYEMVARRLFKVEGEIPLVAIAPTQEAIIEYVASHPDGLGIASFALWNDTAKAGARNWRQRVRILDFQTRDTQGAAITVKLSQQSVYDQVYPLTYSLFIYTSEKRPGTAQGFSAFVAGDVGQRVIQFAGLVPKTMPYRTIQLTEK